MAPILTVPPFPRLWAWGWVPALLAGRLCPGACREQSGAGVCQGSCQAPSGCLRAGDARS